MESFGESEINSAGYINKTKNMARGEGISLKKYK